MRIPHSVFLVLIYLCLVPTAYGQPVFDQTKVIKYDPSSNTLEWPWLSRPPIWDINSLSAPYWEFFWIFGDGHYKLVTHTNRVKHTYETPGIYEVKVIATPYYSTEDTKRTTATVIVSPTETKAPKMVYDSVLRYPNELLFLDHSGDGILTSQNSQGYLALHYRFKFPPCVGRNDKHSKSEGYIILFYDEKAEKWDDIELKHLPDGKGSDGIRPSFRSVEQLLEDSTVKQEAAARLKALQRKYEHLIILKAPIGDNLAEATGRLFYEFEPGPYLSRILKGNDKREYHIDITAALVSNACRPVEEEEFFFFEKTTSLKVEEIRDPNGISVRPTKAVAKGESQELTYLVTFKNDKDGKAKDVLLKMPLQDALAIDVKDASDIVVLERDPSEEVCPPCQQGDIEAFNPCFEKKLKPGIPADTIIFIFHNIYLRGRKKDSLSLTERPSLYHVSNGKVQFRVKTGRQIENQTQLPAIIQFAEALPIITSPARTEWEIRRRGVVLGGNLANSSMCGLGYEPINFIERLSYGFCYESLPVHDGSGWGIQANINTNSFLTSTETQREVGISSDSLKMTSETHLKLTNLDLQGRWIFRSQGNLFRHQTHFNYGVGLGVVVPLSGYLRGDARLASSDTLFLDQLTGSSEVRFGLFRSSNDTLFNRRFSSNNTFGLLSTIFGEIELSNNLCLGIEGSNRLYPWLISKTSFSDFRAQIYIKWFLPKNLPWLLKR